MSRRNPLSIEFQLRHRAQHYTTILHKHRFYANTTYQYRTLINIASISPYCNLLLIRSLDTVLIQNLILRNIISTSVSRHTDNTQALHPCHNTACFVTARLAVQLNRIIQNHSMCHYVATTHCIFPKSSSITLVVATVFSKTVAHNSFRLILYIGILKVMAILQKVASNHKAISDVADMPLVCRNCILQAVKRCLFFIWCFFKKNCFVTPSFNIVGFVHIDYVRNAIGISMTYQSDKYIVSCSYATPWQSLDDIVTAKSKGEQLKTGIRLRFLFNAMRFRAKKIRFSKIVSRVTLQKKWLQCY